MGIVESVKAVMWARQRQPEDVAYGIALGHERFGPRELLDQAVEAERAGFDFVVLQRPSGALVGPGRRDARRTAPTPGSGSAPPARRPRRCRWARR